VPTLLPPLRLTASSTSRSKVKQAQAPKSALSRLKRTRQARSTPTMPLWAATSVCFLDVFQSPDQCPSHAASCAVMSVVSLLLSTFHTRASLQLLLSPLIKTVPCGSQTCAAGFRHTNSSFDPPSLVNGCCCRRHPSSSSAFLPIPVADVVDCLPCMQPIIYRAVG
jgi:hypothetical protein